LLADDFVQEVEPVHVLHRGVAGADRAQVGAGVLTDDAERSIGHAVRGVVAVEQVLLLHLPVKTGQPDGALAAHHAIHAVKVPKDAKVIAASLDRERRGLWLTLSSANFALVAEGQPVPTLQL
jgi:ribosomal protein S28E/S33